MLLVDKDTNFLDDKKEAVVTTPLSEKKLLTNEKVTTSSEVQKSTEKITRSEEVVKGNDEVQKHTDNITKMRRLKKVLKNRKIQKRQWSQSVERIQIRLRVSLKDTQDGLILIMSF